MKCAFGFVPVFLARVPIILIMFSMSIILAMSTTIMLIILMRAAQPINLGIYGYGFR
ncbi:unknown [Clostridium sp. CAG:451]|nr:unknown [Clostridium sp. CAG:451]